MSHAEQAQHLRDPVVERSIVVEIVVDGKREMTVHTTERKWKQDVREVLDLSAKGAFFDSANTFALTAYASGLLHLHSPYHDISPRISFSSHREGPSKPEGLQHLTLVLDASQLRKLDVLGKAQRITVEPFHPARKFASRPGLVVVTGVIIRIDATRCSVLLRATRAEHEEAQGHELLFSKVPEEFKIGDEWLIWFVPDEPDES